MDAKQYSNFGPNYRALEQKLSDFFRGYALPVSSATMGLYIAYLVEFKPGEIVGIPTFTFPATAQAARAADLQINIVNCSEGSWGLDPANFHDDGFHNGFVITSPFGHMIDHEYFDRLAKGYKKKLVYDLAAGFFLPIITPHPRVYSFHATKQFPIGEGGCVVFGNKDDFEFAKKLINFSYTSNQQIQSEYGTNGKMDEMHCAMAMAQFDNLESILNRQIQRQLVHKAYSTELKLKGQHSMDAMQLCVFPVPDPKGLIAAGKEKDITFRRYYYPLLEDWRCYSHRRLSPKESVLRHTVAFPSDLETKEEFDAVVKLVKRHLL